MALPPSKVSGSSWPEPIDFVFRKKRRKGRRGRRGSKVAAKAHAKLKRHVAELIAAPFRAARDTGDPTPMLRRTYGGVAVASDPFKGKTCPGCGAAFGPDYPPIMFDRKDPDFGWLSGHCVRCVQRPDTIKTKRRRWVAMTPAHAPAQKRYLLRLRYPGGARSKIDE